MKGCTMLAILPLALATSGLSGTSLERAVHDARTQAISPHAEPPSWMDFDRVRSGYALMKGHGREIVQTLGTSSLAATFAARDVAPVLVQTGRLPHEFTARMKETEARMFTILVPPKDRDAFVKRAYAQAVSLGRLHVEVADEVRLPLGWDPKVRVPMNGQAYAFVLYTFAYWPVEALIAQKALDSVADAKAIDDWLYLWSVVGYGMGVPEPLLPKDRSTAQTVVALLRKAQYAGRGERPPEGVPVLLGDHVRMMAERTKREASDAAKSLADSISISPGLGAALGLGPDPSATLLAYAKLGN